MSDLISRQAALKKLAVYIYLIDKTMGKGTLTDDDCMEAAKSVLGEDELPAVQPDHTADVSKKVEGDCISRQAAIDLFPNDSLEWDTKGGYIAPHLARRMIEELPFAQPKTCEGCKHLGKWEFEVEYGYSSPCTLCKRRVVDYYER